MPARGLIIAIQNYAAPEGLADELPGSLESAKKFRDWLKGAKVPNDSEIIVCADDPAFPGRTHGAQAHDIRKALYELWKQGADKTEELFVFFSGHGFLFDEGVARRAADVLVAQDFGDLATGGASCLKLDAIQLELRSSMGPGNHYYFVDACRNQILQDDISVGPLGVRLRRSALGDARLYTLFSTSRLAVAPAASSFPGHLVDGLKGKGRAKRPAGGNPPHVQVVWESLEQYVKAKIPASDGMHDGGASAAAVLWDALLTNNTCTITIRNATDSDTFRVIPKNSVGAELKDFNFQGSQGQFQQPPDDYYLQVRHPEHRVVPLDPPPVDLYENTTAQFEMQTAGFSPDGSADWSNAVAPLPTVPRTQLLIIGPASSRIFLRHGMTGAVEEARDRLSTRVAPGAFCAIEAVDRDGTLIDRRDITAEAVDRQVIDLRFRETPLRAAIAAAVPSSREEGWLNFSRTLKSSVSDPDLGLWLSIIGASRVLGQPLSKLAPLPLHTFDDARPESSSLYILAGFDEPKEAFRIGVAAGSGEHRWRAPREVPGLPGLVELVEDVPPGGLLLSFGETGRVPSTIASFALPNRATVVTVTEERDHLSIQQLLLPIGSLKKYLPRQVRKRLPRAPLRAVKFVAQAQRMLASRRSVTDAMLPGEEWDSVLNGKWLDPMMAIVACYELLRQGKGVQIDEALGNLRTYFTELPDTAALVKLRSPEASVAPPSWPPLIIDGFSVFPEGTFTQLPEQKVDYTDLWTTWRNAVPRARKGGPRDV